MNKQICILSAALLAVSLSANANAITVAQWTFETSVPASAGPFAAEVGTGSALGSHTSASAVYSNPVGNGSAESFSSNNWSVGDYYQFQTSTSGYADVMLSWDQNGSSTGPSDFKLSYGTDGVSFTDFSNYSLPSGITWSSATYNSSSTFAMDLSAITALDNATSVYFRLVDRSTTSINGGTVATAGTGRVDNFTVSAVPVPEPETYALMLAGLGLVGFIARRRKN